MDGTTFAGVLASDRQLPDVRVVLNSADAAPPPDVSVSAFLKMARKGELVIEKSKCRVSKIESRTRSLLATLDSRRTAAAHGRQGR
jgi:hypothetical protein